MTTVLGRTIDAFDDLCTEHGWDWELTLTVGTDAWWSAQLRVTEQPNNPSGPDRSRLWYATAGDSTQRVVASVIKAARHDLAEVASPQE